METANNGIAKTSCAIRELHLQSWRMIHEASGFLVHEHLQKMQALLSK